jgi:hypothetical protein
MVIQKTLDIEERLNLFISQIIEDEGIEVDPEAAYDEALTQDFADILNRIEKHLEMASDFKP